MYNAFISYSHAVDGKLAPRLQSAVRRFASPWYRRSSLRIFRDQTDLSISPGLWSSIEKALSESRHLILLASPRAAASKWVRRELEYWLAHNSPQTLLVVVTEGGLEWDDTLKDFDWARTDALPNSLGKSFPEEPLYLDLRSIGRVQDLAQDNPLFRDTVAALAAVLLGRPKDELIGEDITIRRRTRRVAAAVGAALLSLTVLLALSTWFALTQRDSLARTLQVVRGQKLAAEAQLIRAQSPNQLEISALLALEAMRLAPSAEAQAQLRQASALLLPPVRQFDSSPGDDPTAVIAGLALSPDGRSFATVGEGAAPRWWDIATGTEIKKFASSDPNTFSGLDVVFTPDGSQILSTSQDEIVFWDTGSGEVTRREKTGETIRALALSADGRYLASGHYGGMVRVTERISGREILTAMHDSLVNDVAFSPDGTLLASGSNDDTVRIWSLVDGRELHRLPHQFGVIGVAFSPDGTLVATGGWEGLARVWEVSTAREVASFDHRGAINSVAFSPDGKRLATAGDDANVRIWDRVTGVEVARATLGAEAVAVAFSADGQYLATAGKHSSSIWKTAYGNEIAQLSHPDDIVVSVHFSADGDRVVTAAGNAARIWDIGSGRELYRLDHGAADVEDVTFSSDGTVIATISTLPPEKDSGTCANVWAADSGARRSEFCQEHSSTGFSRDGRYVALSGGRGTVSIRDLMAGTTVATIDSIAGANFQSAVALSPELRYLAVGTGGLDDHQLHIVETGNGAPPRTTSFGDRITQLAFSADERLLAVATEKGVGLWDSASGRELARIALSAIVTSVAFSADGHHLATAGRDQTVRVWEIPVFNEVARFDLGGVVSRVAFSPDMELVAAASSDRTARVWRWKTDLVKDACGRLSRNLTRAEWQTYLGDEPYRPTCPGLPSL